MGLGMVGGGFEHDLCFGVADGDFPGGLGAVHNGTYLGPGVIGVGWVMMEKGSGLAGAGIDWGGDFGGLADIGVVVGTTENERPEIVPKRSRLRGVTGVEGRFLRNLNGRVLSAGQQKKQCAERWQQTGSSGPEASPSSKPFLRACSGCTESQIREKLKDNN